jgi:hypothetical protein
VDVDGVEKYQQFGYINFHARWGIRAKLTLAIKNKWSAIKNTCARKGQEPPFDCGDDDSGDTAFIRATKFIGGLDIVEEFVAHGMHPLATQYSIP